MTRPSPAWHGVKHEWFAFKLNWRNITWPKYRKRVLAWVERNR